MGPATSLTLIASLRTPGNDAAWARFAMLYGESIRTWCIQTCRTCGLPPEAAMHVAEEATADSMAEIWTAIQRYRLEQRHGAGGFRAWLGTITERITWAKIRWHANKRAQGSGDSALRWQIENVPDPGTLHGACNGVIDRELRIDAIALTLGRANDHDRRVFQELLSVDRPSRDVLQKTAAALGISIADLYQVKCRLLKKIRLEYKRLVGEFDAL